MTIASIRIGMYERILDRGSAKSHRIGMGSSLLLQHGVRREVLMRYFASSSFAKEMMT